MTELASQHEHRGNTDEADAVLRDLEKVMAKVVPSQPYRHAGGEAVRQRARYALAFQRAYLRDEEVLRQAGISLEVLPKKVDGRWSPVAAAWQRWSAPAPRPGPAPR